MEDGVLYGVIGGVVGVVVVMMLNARKRRDEAAKKGD